MALTTESFNADGIQRNFQVATDILSESHVRVHYYYDEIDHGIPSSSWDLLGKNTVLFDDAPTDGYVVKITISTDGEGLDDAPTTLSELAANVDNLLTVSNNLNSVVTTATNINSINTTAASIGNVNTVSGSIDNVNKTGSSISNVNKVADDILKVNTVSGSITNVNTVASDITKVNSVATTVVPNIDEILLADDNAATATAQASIATNKASDASDSAGVATLNATSAAASASSAAQSASEAAASASEASTSASNASTSETNASTSEANALIYKNEAAASATLADSLTNQINPVASSVCLNNDSVTIDNVTITNGFSATTYTGNGTTQDIDNGIDFISSADYSGLSLWIAGTYNTGDEVKIIREGRTVRVVCLQDGVTSNPNTLYSFTDATFSNWKIESETNGGMSWTKCRSNAFGHYIHDTIRGDTFIKSDSTGSETSLDIIDFTSTGFTIKGNYDINNGGSTYISWSYQTTQIKSGLTNQGKPYIEESNPVTGYTQIKYKGSGLAGHEIPHSLGRELSFRTTKQLDTTYNWVTTIQDDKYLYLNTTYGEATSTNITIGTDTYLLSNSSPEDNASNGLFITYGFANAQENEDGTYTGIFDIGTYGGTGVAGNKVGTRFKLAYNMIKSTSLTQNWSIFDNQRSNGSRLNYLRANTSQPEYSDYGINFEEDGFVLDSYNEWNTSGGQYLYFGIRDNSNGDGKSKYPKPSDSANIQLTDSNFNYTNGKTKDGYVLSSKNVASKTVQADGLADGWYWLSENEDGSNTFFDKEPSYGMYEKTSADDNRPVFIDGKWYSTVGEELVTNGTFDTDISGWTAYNGATFSNVSGQLQTSGGSSSYSGYTTINVIKGKVYKFKYSMQLGTSVGARLVVGQSPSDFNILYSSGGNTTGSYEAYLVANTTETWYLNTLNNGTIGTTFSVDNISVYAVEPTISTPITPTPSFTKRVYVSNGSAQYFDNETIADTYVDSLEAKEVKAQEFKGKNACTAWVNFDGTTTPPTIRDSFNVSDVVRTAIGRFDIYFEEEMNTNNYSVSQSAGYSSVDAYDINISPTKVQTDKFSIWVRDGARSDHNAFYCNIQIFGGME